MRTAIAILLSVVACGGGQSPIPDANLDDGPIPPLENMGSCSFAYESIPGGQANHRYLAQITLRAFAEQRSLCVDTGGYLAIPGDAGELSALVAHGGNVVLWMGISDVAAEGTLVDDLGAAYSALAISNNSESTDCAIATSPNALELTVCTDAHVALCECDN